MDRPIRFSDVEVIAEPVGYSAGSSAPQLSLERVTLRCRLLSTDHESLEALRYARRAMLREEWTRGVEDGEPSLEDAVFSVSDLTWAVPSSAVSLGRAKLAELAERANRARAELSPEPRRS
jgi:hypothetical protein